MLFRLALRNLLRNRSRTLTTLCGIALSLGILIVSLGFLNGVGSQSINNLIAYQTAHFKISLPGYEENKDTYPLDYLWSNSQPAIAALERQEEVVAATARLSFPLSLNDGENELPCQGIGIDLTGTDENVFQIKDAVVDGHYLTRGAEEMLLGDDLAELFQVKAGDDLTVIARTRFEAFEALDLSVAGIVKTGNPRIDKNVVFFPLSLAQRLLEAPGQVTEIAVKINAAAEDKLSLLEKKFIGVLDEQEIPGEVFSWQDLASDFIKLHSIKKKAQAILLGLIVIIAAVGITNTMVMVTFERTREIGTMMALGMRRFQVLLVFLTEGALIGVTGSILGCLWGGGLTRYWEVHGIDLAKFYGNIETPYPIKDYMYSQLSLDAIVYTLLFGIVISVLASGFPALRASKLNPAESLRSH